MFGCTNAPSYVANYPQKLHLQQIITKSFIEQISRETDQHIEYLNSIGLGERAKGIKFRNFEFNDDKSILTDLSIFDRRSLIPQEVLCFDPSAKNTLITTDPASQSNKWEDIQKILDIRLYPSLRELIKSYGIEIFLGSKQEMAAYYRSKKSNIYSEFIIPSSAVYFLAEKENGKVFIIMSGLVGRDNLIAQMITLKLAEVDIRNIEILGEYSHFAQLLEQDVNTLLAKMPYLKVGRRFLIVAGCGLEERVTKIVKSVCREQFLDSQFFHGNILSLTHLSMQSPVEGVQGFLSVNLNYGEITEKVTSLLLNRCNCKFVFTGSAGGFIAQHKDTSKPLIGSRINIDQCMNEAGQVTKLHDSSYSNDPSKIHLQIPSIFLETYHWLETARVRGSSVDIETFYIMHAIQKYNEVHPNDKVHGDCGYFVSDYVGEQPLREYSKVFQNYETILSQFIKRALLDK